MGKTIELSLYDNVNNVGILKITLTADFVRYSTTVTVPALTGSSYAQFDLGRIGSGDPACGVIAAFAQVVPGTSPIAYVANP